MTLVNKISRILCLPSTDERLKFQLRFAYRLSKIEGGKFDDLLNSVCNKVLEKSEVSKIITPEITEFFENELAPISKVAKEYTLHMVSHAHIDMNWQWGYQETVNITLDTFRTMLRLMEEYPDFTFSQSQASTYEICEKHDPELFDAIVKKVREGRWEVSASTWTEGDKNLPTGESLVRHNLYTKQYMKEKFGLESKDLCLDFEPDTFGHSAFVPEICEKGEIKYYYHCRGKELEYAYVYKAPSGAKILCYQDPYFYGNVITNDYFFETALYMYEKRGTKTSLFVYGVGDHGGGPSRRDIEIIKRVQQYPISPKVIFSSYKNFFNDLEKDIDKFPVIDTERNFVFTGCYSSQSEIKAGNRICEDRLFTTETLSAVSGILADTKPYTNHFGDAWKKVLFNQFHDILPGSCVKDSRHHALGVYQEALGIINARQSNAVLALANCIDSSAYAFEDDLAAHSVGGGVGFGSPLANADFHTVAEYGRGKTRVIHVFNPTAFDRDEVTEITIWDWNGDVSRLVCENTKGENLPYSMRDPAGGYWGHSFVRFAVKVCVPAFGVSTLIVKEGECTDIAPVMIEIPNNIHRIEYAKPFVLENDLVKVEFDSDMCITSFVDKTSGKEYINAPAGYFECYVENGNGPMASAWSETSPIYTENINKVGNVFVDLKKIAEKGIVSPTRSQISYTIKYKQNIINVTVTLPIDSSVLKYDIEMDWREEGVHLKEIPSFRMFVPLAYSFKDFWHEVPMGIAKHPQLYHDIPGRTFAFAPQEDKGIAVMCDVQGAYRGWNDTLSVTLLRSTALPDIIPEHGIHHFRVGIGILPSCEMELYKAANSFIHPLPFASVVPHKGTLPTDGQFMKVDGKVIVSGIKSPENSKGKEMIIRFYSLSDAEQKVKISFAKTPVKAQLVNSLEVNLGDLIIDGNDVVVDAPALSITAIKVAF